MRVLIFQAAVSAIGIAAMTRFADEVRAAGHHGGLRSLPHFRREKEPADRIIVALSPAQAEQYKNLGAELVQIFNDTDRILPLQLPDDEKDLADFDFGSAVSGLDDEGKAGSLSMEQLRAEAIERGIEVTAATTREQLEHSLDLDGNVGAQAGDRVTDRANMEGVVEDRIGMRTSTILPSANGLDLERMNDEQLQATAAGLGIKVGKNVQRSTLINKITSTFAEKVGGPKDAAPKSPAESFDDGLDGQSGDQLRAIAEAEGVDLGRTTTDEGMVAKIVEARRAKADPKVGGEEDDDNG